MAAAINPQIAALMQHLQGSVPAPTLAPGTYAGAYAAQGLRTSNPQQAGRLWESRHPAAMQSGNIPPWVLQAETPQDKMDPHATLQNIVNTHRANNNLPAMHPEELHARVTNLAHEILNGRKNRLQKVLGGIGMPGAQAAPPVQPFTAS